jgi:hypothetical protein
MFSSSLEEGKKNGKRKKMLSALGLRSFFYSAANKHTRALFIPLQINTQALLSFRDTFFPQLPPFLFLFGCK